MRTWKGFLVSRHGNARPLSRNQAITASANMRSHLQGERAFPGRARFGTALKPNMSSSLFFETVTSTSQSRLAQETLGNCVHNADVHCVT